MATELTIDQHNKKVAEKVNSLKAEIIGLEKLYKSESEKPQATLAECNRMTQKNNTVKKIRAKSA